MTNTEVFFRLGIFVNIGWFYMLNKFFKSVIDADEAPVVICDTDSVVVYMNAAALKRYKLDLTGKSIMSCHNAESVKKIGQVVEWFKKSTHNNKVFTYRNVKENKDVYMVALRDGDGTLLGYYEKHEYRNPETAKLYAVE